MQVMCRPPSTLKNENGCDNMTKKEKVKNLTLNDIEKLRKRFADLDSDVGTLGLCLVDELKFTFRTLKKLKTNINKNGVVVKMDQGKYEIDRTNPALTTYNTLIKNYQTLSKQINDMLDQAESSDPDDFDNDEL